MPACFSSCSHERWIFVRFFLALFCAMTLASCGPAGNNYLDNGIGSQLPAPESDIIRTANLQNKYFNYLCQQAGIGAWTSSYAQTSCDLDPINDRKWILVVAQGMNDIDRRCDAYLEWLDNKKRSKAPLISQIGSVRAATTGIMGIAEASTKALTVAGLAFDLISQSVENYHSRLLLEVESSTVNSIVLNVRRKFRADFRQQRIAVTDRPQAEYILRSYLRLCLPFAIEANINNYSTLGSSGIAPTSENTINWSPQSGIALGKSVPAEGAVGTVNPTPPVSKDPFLEKSVGLSADEKAMAGSRIPEVIQNALCVEPDGVFGNTTRNAIVAAKGGLRHSNANIPGIQSDKTNTLNTSLIDFFSHKTDSCFNHALGYKNAFEKYAYNSTDRIKVFQDVLNQCEAHIKSLATDKTPFETNLETNGGTSGRFDPDTRKVIMAVRNALRVQTNKLDENFASDVITQKFHNAVTTSCRFLDQSNFQQPK